jgi:hypothetical protein
MCDGVEESWTVITKRLALVKAAYEKGLYSRLNSVRLVAKLFRRQEQKKLLKAQFDGCEKF